MGVVVAVAAVVVVVVAVVSLVQMSVWWSCVAWAECQ